MDPLREPTDVSAQGPSNPLGDRPRMAEALASLKEGLRDTADPLYDGWKLRPRAPNASPQKPAPEAPPRPAPIARKAAANSTDAGETIEITLEGTPDRTPAVSAGPPPPALEGDGDAAAPVLEDWFSQSPAPQDDVAAQDVLIEVVDEEDEAAPASHRRASVQTDTVRVRVIRYQHFPRWALIAAAAFLLFAASLLVLRLSFPRQNVGSARAVLSGEMVSPTPAATSDRAGLGGSVSANAATPVATVPRSGAQNPAPIEAASPPEAALVPNSLPGPSISPATATASTSPPAVKMPGPSPKRRPGGHDFFRDPGF